MLIFGRTKIFRRKFEVLNRKNRLKTRYTFKIRFTIRNNIKKSSSAQ